jgi:hypothetical protein
MIDSASFKLSILQIPQEVGEHAVTISEINNALTRASYVDNCLLKRTEVNFVVAEIIQ